MSCLGKTADRIMDSVDQIDAQSEILKTENLYSLFSNAAINYLVTEISKAVGATVPETRNILADQTSSALEIVQRVLTSFVTSVEGAAENYKYYFAIRHLKTWLKQRISVMEEIQNILVQIYALSQTNVIIRVTPSASKEVKTLLSYLHKARLEVKRSFISSSNVPDIINGKIKLTDVYRLDKAFYWLNEAQKYIMSLTSNKYITQKEKELISRLESYIKMNWNLLSQLIKLIPIYDGFLSTINFEKTLLTNVSDITKSIFTHNTENLKDLNDRIGKSKNTLATFNTTINEKVQNVNRQFYGKMATFYSPELDSLINNIETNRPRTFAEFLLKAPGWYARIEYIKYSIFLNKPSVYDGESEALSSLDNLGDLLDDSLAVTFYKEILQRFGSLASVIYIGNIMGRKNIDSIIMRLKVQTYKVIDKDKELLRRLEAISTSSSYVVFESTLDAGLNALSANAVFGEYTPYIIESIKTGEFLSLDPLSSIESTMSALSKLWEFGSDDKNFKFDCNNIVGSKRLFPPSVSRTTTSTESNNILDAQKEVNSGISKNLQKIN